MRIIGLVLASVFAVGCYATTGGVYTPAYVGPSVSVSATTVGPDLVYVSPGVQVIADYDEPVFYSDGFYWRESGGIWYRSSYHTHGWVSYRAPRAIYSIRDRHSYRRYRPAGWSPRYSRDNRAYRGNNRSYNNRPNTYRDNRANTRPNRSYNNNRPNPRVNRDVRYNNAPNVRPARSERRNDNRPNRRSNDRDKKNRR